MSSTGGCDARMIESAPEGSKMARIDPGSLFELKARLYYMS